MFSKEYKDDSVVFKDKNMPFKYYRRIIDDIGDTLITLRLWHYGEPFLNPDIFHMIRYAKKKGIIVAISSNLSLLTKKKAKKLIYSGLDYLIVSFDGASEYTYNLYHGKDYFKKVVTNLRMLIELKKELKFSTPFIELQFIVMKENEREIEKIKYLAEKLGINKLTYQKLYGENINFDKFVGFDSLDDILPRNKNYCFGIKSRKWFNFCRLFWEETLVRYSGVVLPCVVDLGQKHQVGRLFNRNEYLGFKRIWNNDRYRKFRKNISKSIDSLDICRKCTKRNNSSEDQIYGSKI
jgi:radical SAM protein with 4Fe4S-binding SPASM domain